MLENFDQSRLVQVLRNDVDARLAELIGLCMLLEGERKADHMFPMMQSVERWQKKRLFHTYSDFHDNPRYRKATDFFISELYAPENLARRNSDLEKMIPFMHKWLPEHALRTVRLALKSQLMAYYLDLQVASELIRMDITPETLDQKTYWQAYQLNHDRQMRVLQVELIHAAGAALEGLVHRSSIYLTLKMARVPARFLGLGEIQGFLERGFKAFRSMKGAEDFLAAVYDRELAVIDEQLSFDL